MILKQILNNPAESVLPPRRSRSALTIIAPLAAAAILTLGLSTTSADAADFLLDFNSTTQDGPAHNEAGYNAYDAAHENPATFVTQSYATTFAQSGAATVSVTPAWTNTTDNRVQQMIDRGAGNDANWVGNNIDLLTDWLGTDSRAGSGGNGDYDGVNGTPTWLTLTLGGLPAGSYDWRSFHHDTEHMHTLFTIELSTDGGASYNLVHSGQMTDSTPGGSPDSGPLVQNGSPDPDPANLPSTANFSFDTLGGDVLLRFTPLAQPPVHTQFFGINGFELTQTAAADLINGLVNYWPLDENLIDCAHLLPGTDSTVADDGSFAGANGTDGIGFATGLFGQATSQNGAAGGAAGQQNDGFVEIPRSGDTLFGATTAHTPNQLTTSVWVNSAGFDTSWQAVVAHGEGSQYRIARRGASNFAGYAGGSGEGPQGVNPFAPGWHHVVAISDGAAGQTRLYVDGVLDSTGGNPNINDAQGGGTLNLNIGANPNTGAQNREWNGLLDDVAQWNRALSDVEIALLYGGGPTSAAPLKVLTDETPPEIFCAQKIVANAPTGGTATVSYSGVTATDNVDGPIPVSCSPPDTTAFPIGTTTVTCSATDSAGNTTVVSFDVCVLEIQLTPADREPASISLRGDPAPGAGGTAPGGSGDPSYPAGATMFAYNSAFLNNSGNISLEATLKLAGTKNLAIFSDAGGSLVPLAVKDTGSPGGPDYLSFNELAIGDNGNSAFVTRTTAGDSHITDDGNSATLLVGSPPPGLAGQPLVDRLSTPALSIDGRLFAQAHLRQGSGTPAVTVLDDSLIWDSDNGVVAREGDPAQGLPSGINYSHLTSRVVANDAGEIAFTGNLTGAGSARTAVWSGDPSSLSVVARRGDPADGAAGSTFASFQAEAISPVGTVVIRATLRSGGVTSANNEGLWTDRSGPLLRVVREDDLAPCGQPGVRFGRFTSIFIDTDGGIVFRAFLKGTNVNSSSDGSVWRSDPEDGSLHLIAREGALANSTDGAIYANLDTVATNNIGGVLILARLVGDTGDTTNKNAVGLWRDRGAIDPALELVMRRGDTVVIGGIPQTVSFVDISQVTNAAGGTGGYGRVLNDSGTAVMKLSLSGLNGGVFTLP